MVIVDTSIWIESWRKGHSGLVEWAAADLILQHPFVTAELGMGSFADSAARERAVLMLDSFAQLPIAEPDVFHAFVAEEHLFGAGIGFVDAHLLLACRMNPKTQIASRDRRLCEQAIRLGLPCVSD